MAIFVFSKMTEKKLFQLTTNSFPNNIKAKFHVTTHKEYILTTKHVFYIKHTPDNMRISYKKKERQNQLFNSAFSVNSGYLLANTHIYCFNTCDIT